MRRREFVAALGSAAARPVVARRSAAMAAASRLARNWHTLIEFCGLVGTILVDEDGIYDPHPFGSSVRTVHLLS